LVSGGSDGRISLWDIRSSKSCLLNFDYENSSKTKQSNIKSSFSGSKAIAHHSSILGLTYTHDGHHILSLGRDSILQLWNASSGVNTLVNYGKVPSNQASVESILYFI
jgi:DNA excision repair protein ERCC-8